MTKPYSVTVYCGASESCKDIYKQAATEVGHFIGENSWDLYFGAGSKGLMGRVAQGCLEKGGRVHGIGFENEFLSQSEPPCSNLTTLHISKTIHDRKQILHTSGDLIVVLPGGVGTLDELMEALTWQYLEINTAPIVILNINGFWNLLEHLLDHLYEERFIKDKSRLHYHVVSSIDALKELAIQHEKGLCS